MANQTFPNNLDQVSWGDFDCMDATLTQEEFDSFIENTSEFTPYNTQSMGTTEVSLDPATTAEYASLLVDQFLTAEQLAFLPVPVSRASHFAVEELDPTNTQPVDTTSYSHQPEIYQQAQSLPVGDNFSLLPNNSCFGTSEFTDPMVEDLDQIFIESSGQANTFDNNVQQTTFADAMNDPNWLALVLDPAYTYGCGPSAAAAAEPFPDQSLMYQAQDAQFDLDSFNYLFNASGAAPLVPAVHQPVPLYPLEEYQNFQFNDDDDIVGDQTVAPPTKQLFLPPSTDRRAPKKHKSTARVAFKSEFPVKSEFPIKSEAGPSTPTQIIRKPLVAISPLKCAGQIKVVNQIKQANGQVVELPYKYSVYKPLRPWGKITYTDRGYLHEDIRFNARRMKDFVSNHPLGDKLVLRIEKHPYEMKHRETGKPQYLCCRAEHCTFSEDNRFSVGDLRIAIDEVAGRFSPDDVKNNCPYFAAGFIHLECFEDMVDTAPLANAGILVPDRRDSLPHEPERVTKQPGFSNNKMALTKKQISEFERWVETHPAGSERAKGKHTLNAAIWISGQRAGRIKTRFPPAISVSDVQKWLNDNRHGRGWGGRRMANGTVAEMESKIAAGKEHEIIAPRNGPNGKQGMKIGGAEGSRKRRRRDPAPESGSDSSSDSNPESGSDCDSDSPPPRHRNKRYRPNNQKAAAEPHRTKKQLRKRPGPTPSSSSRLTYFDSAAVLPKKTREESVDSLREITAEEAMATTNRMSSRIKKEVKTYVISDDDDDSGKENKDPTYTY